MMSHAASRAERYVEAAVRAVLDELENTAGGRNAALNKAAFALGQFVGAGVLDEGEVVSKLTAACEANGYSRKDGRRDMMSTIKSGLRKGAQSPRTDLPPDEPAGKPQPATIAEFADIRKLPAEALQFYGWRDTDRGIEIPYTRPDGSPGRTRIRGAMDGEKRFWWARDDARPIVAYQPDRSVGSSDLVVCEGESDAVTLSYSGFRALGVPGADMARTVLADHLAGVARVFIAIDSNRVGEPDSGAEKFVPSVRKRLAELGHKGSVFELLMPDRAKDASALFVRDPEGFAAKLRESMRAVSEGPRPKYLTLAESIVSSLRPLGQRLTTGFSSLDEATRGGPPLGRLIALAGAPGAGKSGLATYLMDRWERDGAAAVYLAADEPAEGIIMRLGQLTGFSREALESEGAAGDAVRTGFAKRCEGRAIAVIDPDADESMRTIEDAETALAHLAGDRPRVLVVDSLQTAQCRAAEGAESARERIDAKMHILKAIAKRGALVVAISEMARSGYRTGDRNTDVSALAAGKESGSIEYGAALLLGLRSVKGEHGQVDVEVAKNRLGGSKPEFRLQMDFERASFVEIEMPERPERGRSSSTEESRAALARERVLAAVRSDRDLKSANAVSRVAGGARGSNIAAVKELQEEGLLVKVGGAFRMAPEASEAR